MIRRSACTLLPAPAVALLLTVAAAACVESSPPPVSAAPQPEESAVGDAPPDGSPDEDPAPDAMSEVESPLRSSFVEPLYLGDAPPPARSVRNVHVAWQGVPGIFPAPVLTKDEARAQAEHVAARAQAGEPLESLAPRYSVHKNRASGAVLGTYSPGMLAPSFDDFLFRAELGEVSGPLENDVGFHVLQRVERLAACRQILVAGDGEAARARCGELAELLAGGADFQALAREHSDDSATAARGGDLSIFERGPSDALLKAAAFRAAPGEVVGPIESPLGYHLVQRVAVDELDPSLYDDPWVRGRALLVAFDATPIGMPTHERSGDAARALADELHGRIVAGADMAELAREFDDDFDGKERGGDLGWLHRRNPHNSQALMRLWLVPPGTLVGPVVTDAGWLILRRDR